MRFIPLKQRLADIHSERRCHRLPLPKRWGLGWLILFNELAVRRILALKSRPESKG